MTNASARTRLTDNYFRDPEHGPFPALLVVLTSVTGIVDAVSILSLGRVFVANMTGNVVFVGFALARAPGFSLSASLAALAGFLAGAFLAGRLVARQLLRRQLFALASVSELALFIAAFALLAADHGRPGDAARDVVAAVLAVALGLQNGVVRRLAVPDLTTTVLTMTLTGLAADSSGHSVIGRRVLAVAAMFSGGLVGALLVLHDGPQWAMACAVGLSALVAGGATLAVRRNTPPN
jgi:uncharacterized membrane protein YoaK (UPF0700 family)